MATFRGVPSITTLEILQILYRIGTRETEEHKKLQITTKRTGKPVKFQIKYVQLMSLWQRNFFLQLQYLCIGSDGFALISKFSTAVTS